MVSMANKRRDKDVMKIMVSGYKVELPDETRLQELIVDFPGPPDSPYVDVSFNLRLPQSFSDICSFLVGRLESAGNLAGAIPNQVAFDRLPEQDFPPEYRRGFRQRLS